TEKRAAEQKARAQERVFRLLVQGVTDYAIYLLDATGTVINWNAGAERAKGYSAAEIVGQNFSKFYTPEDRATGLPERALQTALRDGKFEGQGWRVRRDGSRFWAHVVLDAIYDEEGTLIGLAKVTRDLSEQKEGLDKLTHLKETLDLALSNMSQGLCLFNEQEQLVLSNPRLYEIYGIEPPKQETEVTFESFLQAIHADRQQSPEVLMSGVRAEREEHLSVLRQGKGSYVQEKRYRGKHLSMHHRPVPGGGWVTTLADITDRKTIEERIVHMAHHDPLTGLANRSCFHDLVREHLAVGRRCALLYLDLDRFKPVNDSLGHAVGDELLRQVAARIQARLRPGDRCARLGGDEFAILLSGSTGEAEAALVAGGLVREISRSFQVKGFEVSVGVSIGIALAPDHAKEADLLLRNADLALYSAKFAGRGCFSVYASGMESALLERRELEADLRKALARGEMSLCYQPVIDDTAKVITSVEALLRWNHPVRGNVPPSSFIPVAEELGLMPEIGDWVLRTACEEASTWPETITLAVNLSTTQFRVPDLVERVSSILRASEFPPERLELEITETAMITDLENTTEVLGTLRKSGIQVALDDFGTGYSSLSFLRSLPFSRIKIDRSFTQDLGMTRGAAAIIRAVTGLCSSLGVATTAEGVETSQQLELLHAEGCREVQGFLISQPVTASVLREWMEWYRHDTRKAFGLIRKIA
ncbi:MAG: EAL domain-containing protein, partial [Rhodospirillales bacterium]|nr:EAL domain-containing protein [Acetobacter sp.]